MKRCAICLTPAPAIAATGRVASLRPVMLAARRACWDACASASSSCRWRVTSCGVAHAGRTSTKRNSAARSAGSFISSRSCAARPEPSETARGRGIRAARSVPICVIGRLQVQRALLGQCGHARNRRSSPIPRARRRVFAERDIVAVIALTRQCRDRCRASGRGRALQAPRWASRRSSPSLEVQAGDLLDALEAAVERGAVHVQRACAASATSPPVFEQALERLDELVAAAVRGEREDRRAAAAAGRRRSTGRRSGPSCRAGRRRRPGRAPARRARTAPRSRPAAAPRACRRGRRSGALTPPRRAGASRARRPRAGAGRGRGSRRGRPASHGEVGGAAAAAQALGDLVAAAQTATA